MSSNSIVPRLAALIAWLSLAMSRYSPPESEFHASCQPGVFEGPPADLDEREAVERDWSYAQCEEVSKVFHEGLLAPPTHPPPTPIFVVAILELGEGPRISVTKEPRNNKSLVFGSRTDNHIMVSATIVKTIKEKYACFTG